MTEGGGGGIKIQIPLIQFSDISGDLETVSLYGSVIDVIYVNSSNKSKSFS